MSASLTECFWCGQPGNLRCSQCKSVSYCGPECQKKHWSNGHKGQCKVLKSKGDQGHIEGSKGDEFKFPEKYLFPQERVAKMLEFKQPLPVGAGLYNAGNTCFMNSVLQCIVYTPGLTTFFITDDHHKTCTTKEFCMLCEIERHTYEVLGSPGQVVFPKNIFANLGKIGQFRLLRQEDAHDFHCQVLDGIHKSFLLKHKGEKLDPKVESTTLIKQFFGGYLQNQVKCTVCGNISRSYEEFNSLPVALDPKFTSVEQALLGFTAIEHLYEDVGYKCKTCDKVVHAEKQMLVRVPPPILVLSLKRFDLLSGGLKINRALAFHHELLLDSIYAQGCEAGCKYDLYAVIVHFGPTAFSGHYVAFVKIEDNWIMYDDDKVFEVSPAIVLKQNAYMLYYKRQEYKSVTKNESVPQSKSSNGKVPDIAKLAISASPKPAPSPSSNPTPSPSSNPTPSPSSNPTPSPSSNPTPSPPSSTNHTTVLPSNPIYKFYYRNAEEDESIIKDFVMKVDMPLLTSNTKIELFANYQGRIMIAVKNLYLLDINIPFCIEPLKSLAQFSQKSGLEVVFPMYNEKPDENAEKMQRIEVGNNSEGASIQVKSDQELEMVIDNSKIAQEKATEEQENKEKEDKEKREKEDKEKKEKEKQKEVQQTPANIETATYANLYKEIEEYASIKKAMNMESGGRSLNEIRAPKTKAKKVGRNEPCPCGSAKKYRFCHGVP